MEWPRNGWGDGETSSVSFSRMFNSMVVFWSNHSGGWGEFPSAPGAQDSVNESGLPSTVFSFDTKYNHDKYVVQMLTKERLFETLS